MAAVDVCGLWDGRVMEDALGMEELALQEIQTGSFVLEWIIHVGLENSSLCVTPSDLCALCGDLQSFQSVRDHWQFLCPQMACPNM